MNETRVSLLLRIKDDRDSNAWQEFDTIYRPMLYRFAKAYGAHDSDAEDVVQQCMGAIHAHIKEFEYDPSKGRFKGWLKTLVNNRMRNRFRKQKEEIARTQHFAGLQSPESNPESMFDKIWMDEHLKHALKVVRRDVEEKTFKAFVMYVIEEKPVEEVCTALDLNQNQVHKAKYRLTRKLAEVMATLTGEDSITPDA